MTPLPTAVQNSDSVIECQRHVMLGGLTELLAHELNNLMTPVIARARDALDRGSPDAMKKALEVTLKQVEQVIRLAGGVSEFAAQRPRETRACNVATLVNRTLAASVRPLSKNGIALVQQVPEDLTILADAMLFQQLLLTILQNARHALKQRRGGLAVSARRCGPFVRIEVRELGGAAEAERRTHFDPLRRASRAEAALSNGASLSLVACEAIVQRFGARIEFEPSGDNAAAVVRIDWPAAT